ncbi:hypothetical protein NBT05_09840 [Aquimarina sp. ERC-38]|uniref:hypothetical protein n=1 Tax=Aquimarina sp. ERC-38 TaxID=2949996 RepID=UPI0022462014|nr:hypothetical protein [Aquimarina sp. ERC-38]UZO79271.1 hypothetical protein NBT05_09840 [Aquimarina sp. ERC-38]
MERKVFIITGHPHNDVQTELFKRFSKLYWTFFNDKSGGAYEKEEIIVLNQPTTEDLKSATKNSEKEFGVVVLIGHGATKENNQLFQINENEIIKAGQLDFSFKKQIIILESCRSKISNIETVDLSNKVPTFRDGGTFRNPLSREKSKELYLEQVKNCDNGLVICLACGLNEEASNFIYSSSLLQIGKNWHLSRQNHLQTMKINELMFLTTIEVLAKTNNTQNPEMIGIREFPFVISKF